MIKTSYHMPTSLVHIQQSRQILTCSHASPSGYNIMASFNLVQMLCSNKPYSLSPSTPLTSSWSQSHKSTSDYPKHCRDRDDISRVLRCDTDGWYETGRFCNFKEPENTCSNWQMMNKVSFTNNSWAANIFLSLHCSEKNPKVLPLHCAWMPQFQNRSFPLYTSLCKQKTVSTTHLQKLQKEAMLTCNYMRKKKKKILRQKHSFNLFLTLRKGLLPLSHMWCNLYLIHTHIAYWLLNGHIFSVHICKGSG